MSKKKIEINGVPDSLKKQFKSKCRKKKKNMSEVGRELIKQFIKSC